MSQGRKVPFALVRFRKFFFHFLRNKMAFAGFVIVVFFSFLALSAPLLSPYTPTGSIVSGQYDPPVWYAQLAGGRWSQNAEFSGLTVQSLTAGVQVTPTNSTVDSIVLSVNIPSSSGGTVQVVKTLSYPYDGAPQSFAGQLSVSPEGLSSAASAHASAIIQGHGSTFTLWQKDIAQGSYQPATLLRDAQDLGRSSLSASEVIFSEKTDYVYALRIVLPSGVSQATFTVSNFKMFLYGTVWGLLGTDNSGNDIFTQLVYGSRVSLAVGLLATFIGISVGLVVGLMAGYLGRLVDEVLMRFTDMMLVLPGLPLLIVLVALLGPSLWNIIGVLGFLGWMGFARVIRSQVLSLRERPFIEAAKASGAGTGYITMRHIFPNIVSLTYVNLALSVPAAIVGEAALSFLGLGPQSVISWGQMLELAHGAATTAGLLWWWVIPPGLCIAVLSLAFILMGYALDEMFNPRLRRRR
jgi:peptide/nickel transport system permease protein